EEVGDHRNEGIQDPHQQRERVIGGVDPVDAEERSADLSSAPDSADRMLYDGHSASSGETPSISPRTSLSRGAVRPIETMRSPSPLRPRRTLSTARSVVMNIDVPSRWSDSTPATSLSVADSLPAA